ncbi:MAG: TIM-barrel domain-containing protein [Sarcina sp.]
MKRSKIRAIALTVLTAIAATNMPFLGNYDKVIAQELEQNNINIENDEAYKSIGAIKSVKTKSNDIILRTINDEQVKITFLGEDVVRVYMDPTGKFQDKPTPNDPSHTTEIIEKQEDEYDKVDATVTEGDIITISTEDLELRVEKATGKMELFSKKQNRSLWKEKEALKYSESGTIQTLETDKNEYFYGGGQQNGRFSHKGKAINIVNENNWVDGGVSSPTPFYVSTNGYGVMRHTFKQGKYDFGTKDINTVTTKHNENRFDAYYFADENITGVVNKFTELTGAPVLLPEYAFYLGHANCYSRDWINDETGQESQTPKPGFDRQETLMVDAKKVLDDHIDNDMPLGWFMPNDGYGCGYGREETIDANVDNLKTFVDYTRSKGIQTALWTQSQLKPTGNQAPYLERDIDKEVGVAGTNGVKTDVAWVGPGYSFTLNSVRQAAEGIENNSKDNARPFVVSLDGWAGTQRYSSIWSGDQYGGEWEYIRFHIPTYIGSGLSGQPNVGSDIDGIFGGNNIIQSRDFQWKAFTPVLIDMDGWSNVDKNPYAFDEPYTSINRMYLKLKGEMMPYIYSIANEATNTGMPMIRAMMLEEANDYTYGKNTQYQYMWGPNMLVAPVYQNTAADDKGNDIRNDIYLPDGDQIWIDYFTGNQYRGGRVLNNFDAPLWKTPLFIKNGAIIPMNNENNTPEEIKDDNRIYEVYPSGETSFEVYEDDGLTTDYKKNKSATTNITSVAPKTGKGQATITVEKLTGQYDNMVTERSTEFIVNVSEKPEELQLTIGNSDVTLTEAMTLEEFENGENMYYYDESPNLNKYATKGSEFEAVEIKTTPKLHVKAAKTDVTVNEVKLVINDFINTQDIAKDTENTQLNTPSNFNAPEESVTPDSVRLVWDSVEGADTYDVEIDGVIFSNIKATEYINKELHFDTEYTYRVRAVNKDGYTSWTDAITVRTALDPHRNVPQDMQVIWKDGHYSNEVPALAIDNNDSTQFHSAGNAIDKDFILDMQKAYSLEKLEMIFRKNGNGSVKRAEIYSSLDGINYDLVFSNAKETGEAAWVTDGEPKVLNFKTPIQARYFKIVTKESVGNFMALREIRPYKVDGTIGRVVGDWNNSGSIEEGDLVFLENYNGLKESDADWGYVSMADLNLNGMIDSYDISYVARQLEGGVTETNEKLDGNVMLLPNKNSVKAGEEFTLEVRGLGLNGVNALSLEIPLDATKFEVVQLPMETEMTKDMKNLSKVRAHSDGNQDLYVTFANVGEAPKVKGTGTLATVKLKAKTDMNLALELTHGMLVDSKLNTKTAILNGVDIDADLPTFEGGSTKIDKAQFVVSGDESQLQSGMGLDKLTDGTTDSADSSRMDLKWIFSADQAEKGTLPFDMTFDFNEAKEFDNFTIYNRINGDGSLNTAALKSVKATGYLDGVETDLGTISNIKTATTTFELKGQKFDKIVVTALESHKDINTLAINEIEFYEKTGADITGIEFAQGTVTELNSNDFVEVIASVTPSNSLNPYYRIKSDNTDVADVIRIDNGKEVKYYLRGLSKGIATLTATTADGKFSITHKVVVDGGVEENTEKPNKVTNLEASGITNNSVSLSWGAPFNTNIEKYIIYKDGKEFTTVTDTNVTIDNLKANKIYGFKVVAQAKNGKKSSAVSINARTLK